MSILRRVQFSAHPIKRGLSRSTTKVPIARLLGKSVEAYVTANQVDDIQTPTGIVVRTEGNLIYFAVEESEDANTTLGQCTLKAYQKIFELLNNKPEYKLLRLWNYVPNILDGKGTLQRYWEFNSARFTAWEAHGPKNLGGTPLYPAATGIGSLGKTLIVEGLLTKHHVEYIQNPRQTPAHLYSKKYGAQPPVFARGSLHIKPTGPEVWVSGTASLLGEDAVWIGDPIKQTEEVLRNIEALISTANMKTWNVLGFSLGDLKLVRVYIKYPKHLKAIQSVVERHINPKHIVYLHDDICRNEWMVEIEGVATKNGKGE